MLIKALRLSVAALLAGAFGGASAAQAEDIKLRVASGHAPATPYVQLMTAYFIPEATKRVAARTKHKIEFVEGYGGSMVKVTDTLEGVQAGVIDIGGYCVCFEPSNLPMHAFQAMLPFGPMSPVKSVAIARTVYDKVPYMNKVVEEKFGQRMLGLLGDTGYNMLTTFDWNTVADLKGRKVSGAGLNLKWLEFAGAVPVQTTAPEVYTSLQTGLYQGVLIFPSLAIGLKWYEVAKHYALAEFGSVTWVVLTVNSGRWAKLPKEVQDILLEVARNTEIRSGPVNEETYPKQLEQLKGFGVSLKTVPEGVKAEWAKSLAKWPQEKADELGGKGIPASQVLQLAVEEAEKAGHKWPHRYVVK